VSAVLTQLVENNLGNDTSIFSSNWLTELPWTAVMAAPLETPIFGAVIPGQEEPCSRVAIVEEPTNPVPIAPPNEP
jgi:hypothetical protein